MKSDDQDSQTLLESLVQAQSGLKDARGACGTYIYSTNRPVANRIAKAHSEIADAIALVSKRISA